MEAFEQIRAFCLGLPGTTEKEPWGPGESAFQIAGRSYCFVTRRSGHANVSAKPPSQERDAWLDTPGIGPAPYLARYGWLCLRVPDEDPAAWERAQTLIWQSHAQRLATRQHRVPTGPGALALSVRRAGVDDVPALATLRVAHWREEHREGPVRVNRRAFMHAMQEEAAPDLAAGRLVAWLGLSGTRPVGCLFLRPVPKVPWPDRTRARIGYITGVYVAPQARKQHVGRALVRAAQDYASREGGFKFLMLWPSDTSHAFYRALGLMPAAGEEQPWLWPVPAPVVSVSSLRGPSPAGPDADFASPHREPVQ